MQVSQVSCQEGAAAGHAELAARLCPNQTVLSDAGLAHLVETAFRASLKREEGRYPSFQLFAPLAKGPEPLLDMRFSPPLPLCVATLHRLSPGIPPRPYAFVVKEGEGGLRVEGVARVEYSGFAALRGHLDYHGGTLFPGLSLQVGGPARIRAVLFSSEAPVTYLELKEGELSISHDNAFSPVFLPLCRQATSVLSSGADVCGPLPSLVKATLARVLSLAVAAGHGGMFVFLPPGMGGVADTSEVMSPGVGVSWPNLGRVALNLASGEPHYSTHVEQWETATRVTAQASCVDGAVILDAALSVLAFRVELLAREDERLPTCVALRPEASEQTPAGIVDMSGFGTRHRSAVRFCAKVPGAVAVVVSQDGEMRECIRLPDGRVGICGPLVPMSVSSPLL
jgi:hypothetical protein